MAQTQDTPKTAREEKAPPTPLAPALLEPSLPPPLPRLGAGRLRFASPSAAPDIEAVPAIDTKKSVSVRLSPARRVNWAERSFDCLWLVLFLACAAIFVYRLHWALQP